MYIPAPQDASLSLFFEARHLDSINRETHFHDFYELYVNLGAPVSFWVENTVLEIGCGEGLLTAPNELHKCLYREQERHEHLCLWFRSESPLFPPAFYARKKGEGNRIALPHAEREAWLAHCRILTESQARDVHFYRALFSALAPLGRVPSEGARVSAIPAVFSEILSYIDENLKEPLRVPDLCRRFSVSKSTLARFFRDTLHTTFSAVVTDKRLALAKELLAAGQDVLNTAYDCGFSDCSHFISVFKAHLGLTPRAYARQATNQK